MKRDAGNHWAGLATEGDNNSTILTTHFWRHQLPKQEGSFQSDFHSLWVPSSGGLGFSAVALAEEEED
jgi:hypothetical protein